MKNKISKLILIALAFFSFYLLIEYLILNRKIKYLNQIYYNLPILINRTKICKDYQDLLKNSLNSSFSASIINDKGKVIGSYNGNKLRIPASNLKLFSTAYTLSYLDISENLATSLYKDSSNNYYLVGSGDPDLSFDDIRNLLEKIKFKKNFNFYILEINNKKKWPKGWTDEDKLYSYGSPITSLAIKSNQNKYIDIFYFKKVIEDYLKINYPSISFKLSIVEFSEFRNKNLRLINQIISSPILSLITLANSESHNFTAESLYKNASNSWNDNKYNKMKNWLKFKGLPVKNIYINDASGLSRDNRLTTNLTALFLHKMRYSRDFQFYKSSLSILGTRGTLSNRMKYSKVANRFFGKTGTLSNVFALSGYLYKNDEIIAISIIQNSSNVDIDKTFKLINDIYKLKKCY